MGQSSVQLSLPPVHLCLHSLLLAFALRHCAQASELLVELSAPVTTSIALHHFTAWARYEEVRAVQQYNGTTKQRTGLAREKSNRPCRDRTTAFCRALYANAQPASISLSSCCGSASICYVYVLHRPPLPLPLPLPHKTKKSVRSVISAGSTSHTCFGMRDVM